MAAWPIGETIVVSFGTSTKSLASGEVGIRPLVAESVTAGTVVATDMTTREGTTTDSDLRLVRVVGGANAAGNTSLSLSPFISTQSMGESFYIEPGAGGAFAFENLPDGTYDIIFAASRNVGAGDGGRVTRVDIEVGSASDVTETFTAENPSSGSTAQHVTFTGVTPASGVIRLGYFALVNFGYMGAIAITFNGAGGGTTPVSKTDTFQWSLLKNITKTNTLQWSVLKLIQKTLTIQWAILKLISKNTTFQWNLLKLITKASQLQWSVLKKISTDCNFKWSVIKLVSKNYTLQWSILKSIQNHLQIEWNLNISVAQSLNLQYSILKKIFSVSNFEWSILKTVIDELNLVWNVDGPLTNVVSNLAIEWNVLKKISKNLILEWNVSGRTVKANQLQWSVLKKTSDTLTLRWNIESTSTFPDLTGVISFNVTQATITVLPID